MKESLRKIIGINESETNRNQWLSDRLSSIPPGLSILDAGAGELRNKPLCKHLDYTSQDFCEYDGVSGGLSGLHTGSWDTSKIDVVSDITNIPLPDASFGVVLCSEVFEHLPDPLKALDEFRRLLKPKGILIITAPFASFVHFSPYHYATGFSRYWYEHHLKTINFDIKELSSNGNWFSYVRQEMYRLPSMAKEQRVWHWPLAYIVGALAATYLTLFSDRKKTDEFTCFGWHCIAIKN